MSNRKNITNSIITNLKLINGQTSTFDNSYTYKSNLYNNVERGFKFEGIHDFPSVYVVAGRELRTYNSDNFTEGTLPITLRIYHRSSTVQDKLQEVIDDIEHVIYEMNYPSNIEIEDITIESISTDEGLLHPFSLGEMIISVTYTLS